MNRSSVLIDRVLAKLLNRATNSSTERNCNPRQITDNAAAAWDDDSRIYLIGLVGESHYQGAISGTRVGDPVGLIIEPDNPYDPDAIAVVAKDDKTIGYVPRDNWVRCALEREGKGCTARVASIRRNDGRHRGVVIEVMLEGPRLSTRRYGQGK